MIYVIFSTVLFHSFQSYFQQLKTHHRKAQKKAVAKRKFGLCAKIVAERCCIFVLYRELQRFINYGLKCQNDIYYFFK